MPLINNIVTLNFKIFRYNSIIMLDKLKDYLNRYKTKHVYGFTDEEINEILENYKEYDKELFENLIMSETSIFSKGETIRFHNDVFVCLAQALGYKKEEIFGIIK